LWGRTKPAARKPAGFAFAGTIVSSKRSPPDQTYAEQREVRHAVSVLDGSAACDLGCVRASSVEARRNMS
jgi:hypothetical protein